MNKNIEQALSGFSYDEQRRMRDVITALDNGKVYSVEFYSDGSFYIKQAQIILAGHRLCSHKIPKCC